MRVVVMHSSCRRTHELTVDYTKLTSEARPFYLARCNNAFPMQMASQILRNAAALRHRVLNFCERFELLAPVLLAPMAGSCPTGLSAAVMGAGGMGACGAAQMAPDGITTWAQELRKACGDGQHAPFQMNLWVPEPQPPTRDPAHERDVRAFLSRWAPAAAPADAANGALQDFDAQCEAVLACKPAAISSIMGLFPPAFVQRCKQENIPWWATATTVAEAVAAEAAGADAIIVQGAEAGGHRGCFDHRVGEAQQVGLMSLLPTVADAVRVPIIAAGGIADDRGVAAALFLGASAVQCGTAFLVADEAGIPGAWRKAIAQTPPEGTRITRAFSGRPGRSIHTAYVRAAADGAAPAPAPYPIQRHLTAAMRLQAVANDDLDAGMQAWAGQSASLTAPLPAREIMSRLWDRVPEQLGWPME